MPRSGLRPIRPIRINEHKSGSISINQDCDKGLWQACVRKGNFKLIWGQVCNEDGNDESRDPSVLLNVCVFQSDLLAKEFGRVRYRLELYDVARYPTTITITKP